VTVWGKGEKRRFVPLGAELRQVLREYLAMRGDAPGALFTGKRLGMRMQARGVEHRLDHIRRAAGLGAEVTPHALRHTFAKQLVDRGQQLPLVRKLLGHSRLDTTARYTMPGWEDMENAVE
jgi:integrase/recombinase XerC